MPSLTIPIPAGHNTINPFAIVPDAASFIRFVEAVFGGRESTDVRTPDRDGSIIHAEIVVGDATIMLCDRKPGWPFTPAFLQIYIPDAESCLDAAIEHDARVVTPISDFYGGYRLARTHGISDPRGGQSNGSCFDHELKPAIHRAPNLQFRFSELLKDLSGAGFVADDLLRSALST